MSGIDEAGISADIIVMVADGLRDQLRRNPDMDETSRRELTNAILALKLSAGFAKELSRLKARIEAAPEWNNHPDSVGIGPSGVLTWAARQARPSARGGWRMTLLKTSELRWAVRERTDEGREFLIGRYGFNPPEVAPVMQFETRAKARAWIMSSPPWKCSRRVVRVRVTVEEV